MSQLQQNKVLKPNLNVTIRSIGELPHSPATLHAALDRSRDVLRDSFQREAALFGVRATRRDAFIEFRVPAWLQPVDFSQNSKDHCERILREYDK